LCKTEFFLIFQKTINGTLIDEIPVEPKVMDEEEVELILENGRPPHNFSRG
jgi:hypothetical protein